MKNNMKDNKKGMSQMDLILDVIILFIGILIIGYIMSLSTTLGIDEIDYEITAQKSSNFIDESFLNFLNSKVDSKTVTSGEEILIGQKFTGTREYDITLDNVKYDSIAFDISFINRSDIYCVQGGYDDICPTLNDYGIIPQVGDGSGFSFSHKTIYVGSHDEFTGDVEFLKNWLGPDKTLILTHDSYDILNDIVGEDVLVKDRFFYVRRPFVFYF